MDVLLIGCLVAVTHSCAAVGVGDNKYEVTLTVPIVHVTRDDVYACVSKRVPEGEEWNIVDFVAHPSAGMHHHMTILLCRDPGSRDAVWDCGQSQFGQPLDGLAKGPACLHEVEDVSSALLTYSYVADEVHDVGLHFPQGVGLKVGGDTGYNWIVLFTHFPDLANLTNGWTKESGITVTILRGEELKPVRTITLVAYGDIGPHSVDTVSGSLLWTDSPIHPFSFNAHSHEHAIRNRVFQIGRSGVKTLIIDHDPVDQRYQPMHDVVITPGDRIEFECAFNNSMDRVLKIRLEEMCEFELFYYVYGGKIPKPFVVYSGDETEE